jgi:hypothetical protein
MRWCSPGLQSGEAGIQTRESARHINFGALALVAASEARHALALESETGPGGLPLCAQRSALGNLNQ